MDRRATAAITLGVLVMLCVVGLLVGFRALTAELPDEPLVEEAPACEPRTVQKGSVVRPRDVVVSVFNAGTRAGAASRTMEQLVERGFVPGDSDNAPRDTGVLRAQVWVDGPINPAARLVAAQFGPDTPIRVNRKPLGVGVMVLVGNELAELPPGVRRVTAGERSEICSPPLE
jgi:hypothetical protein